MMDRTTFEWMHEIASERDDLAEALGQVTMERDALLDTATELRMADREQRQVIAGLRVDLEQQRAAERARITRLEDAMHAMAAHRDGLREQVQRAERRHAVADRTLIVVREREAELLEAIGYARDELAAAVRADRLLQGVREMIDFLTRFAPKPAGGNGPPDFAVPPFAALAKPGSAA